MDDVAMTDDLIAFLHQHLENQRFRAGSLKTLAYALPSETGAYLTETGDLLLADVDAKRRILADYEAALAESDSDPNDPTRSADASTLEWVVKLLALPHAGHPDYRDEWRP